MSPLYKWFYLAEGLGAVALIAQLLQASLLFSPSTQSGRAIGLPFTLIFHHVPLATAVTIGLIVTWKYWCWLITERDK